MGSQTVEQDLATEQQQHTFKLKQWPLNRTEQIYIKIIFCRFLVTMRFIYFIIYKEIKSVNPKENQPWIFIGRTDAEAEAPIFWPPFMMSQLTGKDPAAGKDWGEEEKGATKTRGLDDIADSKDMSVSSSRRCWRTGSLVCCRPWGHKQSDTTEQLKNSNIYKYVCVCVCVYMYQFVLNW